MLFIELANVLLPLIKALFILIVACSSDVSPPSTFEIIKGVEKQILVCTLNKQSLQGGCLFPGNAGPSHHYSVKRLGTLHSILPNVPLNRFADCPSRNGVTPGQAGVYIYI